MIRRIRTNTPLAALITLNDPVYVEAAAALARLTVREAGPGVERRAAWAFRRATGRPARPGEVARLVKLYRERLARYRGNDEEALKMASSLLGAPPTGSDVAVLAAWTVVANVLLNLDEVLTKG